MVSKAFLGGLGVKEREQPELFAVENRSSDSENRPTQQATGPKRAHQPTLIDHLERKKAEATSKLTDFEKTELITRFESLRGWIPAAKARLFDAETAESLPDWETKYQKLVRWMSEYEALVVKMAENGLEPVDLHCKRCWTLILVAWEGNDQCEYCTGTPSRKRLYGMVQKNGAVRVQCPTLDNECITVVRDDSVSLPDGEVGFSVQELYLMRGLTPEQARQVWEIKREMGGKVVGE